MKNQTAIQFLLEQFPQLESEIPATILIHAQWQEEKTIDEAFHDGQKNGYLYAKKIDVLQNALDYYRNKYRREK